MKPNNVNSNTYIDCDAEKLVNIREYKKIKNIFAKGYTPHLSEQVFVIKKIEILYRGNKY